MIAKCNAVCPFLSRILAISGFFCNISLAISLLPSMIAKCNAVCPFLSIITDFLLPVVKSKDKSKSSSSSSSSLSSASFFKFKPLSFNNLIMFSLTSSDFAKHNAICPLFVFFSKSSFVILLIRYSTTCASPLSAAQCNGVCPYSSCIPAIFGALSNICSTILCICLINILLLL